MQARELSQLVIATAETDADLESLITVRKAADPRARPTLVNLRHALTSSRAGLVFLVARLGDRPMACGFVERSTAGHAAADVTVVPSSRRRAIATAMLAEASAHAARLGKERLQLAVRKSDEEFRSLLEQRGFERVGGEEAVSLQLAGDVPEQTVPDGIDIVSRSERPFVAEALFEVFVEAEQDVPGTPGGETIESWSAREIDRPSRSPDLSFVAYVDDEPVGYAVLDVRGNEGHHGFTAVKRAWRRRGVATALKQAQIRAATEIGLTRLVTGSEERNLPMRTLNERLGYRPDPELSTVVMEGPLQRL